MGGVKDRHIACVKIQVAILALGSALVHVQQVDHTEQSSR